MIPFGGYVKMAGFIDESMDTNIQYQPDEFMSKSPLSKIFILSARVIMNVLTAFLLFSAILCLIFGSILFISGFKQRLGAYLLLLFIIPTTFIFHFSPFQTKAVLMNAALIGGLLLGIKNKKSNSLKEVFNNQIIKNN